MKYKKTSWIIAVLSVLLILVLIRTFNQNLFKRQAADAIVAAKNNMLTVNQLQSIPGDHFIVELEEENKRFKESFSVPFSQLLDKQNREKLENIEGDIYLYSNQAETAAKAWVILNQLGFDNVFILTEEEPEVLKYKFQPDTITRLE